jgi:hypothetical protein
MSLKGRKSKKTEHLTDKDRKCIKEQAEKDLNSSKESTKAFARVDLKKIEESPNETRKRRLKSFLGKS